MCVMVATFMYIVHVSTCTCILLSIAVACICLVLVAHLCVAAKQADSPSCPLVFLCYTPPCRLLLYTCIVFSCIVFSLSLLLSPVVNALCSATGYSLLCSGRFTHVPTCAGDTHGSDDGVFWFLQLLEAVAADTSLAEWAGQKDQSSISTLSQCQREGHS